MKDIYIIEGDIREFESYSAAVEEANGLAKLYNSEQIVFKQVAVVPAGGYPKEYFYQCSICRYTISKELLKGAPARCPIHGPGYNMIKKEDNWRER